MAAPIFNSEEFKNPDKSYRPAPFWSLNGKLEDEQLKQQIRDFKEIGFGGYFMHPRPGMKTHYLQDEWFDRVKCMVETGKQENMEPWLYDEDSYPSGFASGKVPMEHPELRAHSLCLVTPEQLPAHPCITAKYGYFSKSTEDRLEKTDKTSMNVAIISSRNVEGKAWYNNQCYIDTLNPATIKQFIESTHEKYAEQFSSAFGKLIPGIFTDEPHHCPDPSAATTSVLPWTPSLPDVFKEKYGYDLIPKIHCLFFDIDDYQAVRFDYFNLVNDMFVNNFCKPMYEWCESHNLELTGHFWEHAYPFVAGQADILTPLKYMHRPGIDLLGRDVDKFSFDDNGKRLPAQVGNCQMVKVAGSVARQYGFNRVMSETWGGGGWDQTLEDHKQSVDWEMLLGINYVVPHLSHYTLEGYRKADYPMSFTRSLPYWKQLHFLNDHIARVCYALSCGETQTQLLVIHPACHNWINYNNDDNLNQHAVELEKLTRWLNTNQYEFDFGDESLLSEDGWVEKGKLGIAKAGYDTVIIPPTSCLHTSTLSKLDEFRNLGGTIIQFGTEKPQLLNGRNSSELTDFFNNESVTCVNSLPMLGSALSNSISRQFCIKSEHGKVMSMTRNSGQYIIFFIANFADKSDNLTIHFTEAGRLYCANTETGELEPIATTSNDCSLTLASGQSRLLILNKSEIAKQDLVRKRDTKTIQQLTGPFNYELLDPNILLLDHCQYAFNQEPFSKTVQVEKALETLKQRYQLEYSPWVSYTREYSPKTHSIPENETFNMQLTFSINSTVPQDTKLAIEAPGNWVISVNNHNVTELTQDFFMDYCFGVFNIAEHLQSGENIISLSAAVTPDLAPANIFILGNFGVNINNGIPAISDKPETLELNDITACGLPFFGGRITYNIPFSLDHKQENLAIKLDKLNAPIIDCKLDNSYIGKIFEAPYQLNIGNVEAGQHNLQITLYSHVKNVFGPHYAKPEKEQVIIGCPMYTHIYEGSRKNCLQITPCGIGERLTLTSNP